MSLYNLIKKPFHWLLPCSVRRYIYRIMPMPLKKLKGKFVRFLEKNAQHNEIYDEHYYQETFLKSKFDMTNSSNIIANSLVNTFHPQMVIDVGCGAGFLLEALKTYGVRCKGLEYSDAAIAMCHKRGLDVKMFNLEHDNLSGDYKADVVLSTEVAEHLPESCADRFVDILCAISKNVVITAAQPSPISNVTPDHVNEQPKEYWISKFTIRGYEYNEELSQQWSADWKASNIEPWYVENLMIFYCAD